MDTKCSLISFKFVFMAWASESKIEEIKLSVPILVGERVRYYRRMKDYTQTDLASMVGSDRQYIYRIEKGKVSPSITTISLLAYALDVPLSQLFENIVL